jgi:hypothetical protein
LARVGSIEFAARGVLWKVAQALCAMAGDDAPALPAGGGATWAVIFLVLLVSQA